VGVIGFCVDVYGFEFEDVEFFVEGV